MQENCPAVALTLWGCGFPHKTLFNPTSHNYLQESNNLGSLVSPLSLSFPSKEDLRKEAPWQNCSVSHLRPTWKLQGMTVSEVASQNEGSPRCCACLDLKVHLRASQCACCGGWGFLSMVQEA